MWSQSLCKMHQAVCCACSILFILSCMVSLGAFLISTITWDAWRIIRLQLDLYNYNRWARIRLVEHQPWEPCLFKAKSTSDSHEGWDLTGYDARYLTVLFSSRTPLYKSTFRRDTWSLFVTTIEEKYTELCTKNYWIRLILALFFCYWRPLAYI